MNPVDTEKDYLVRFIVSLHKIVRAKIMPSDVIVLYAIIAKPGSSGQDVKEAFGWRSRSLIQYQAERLIRRGYVEDRRERKGKLVPAQFHPTPAGIAFWESVKP